MGFIDKLGKVASTIVIKTVDSGKALGTQVHRKVRKPFRYYMAQERAEQALEKQKEVPKRSPLNLPKMEFSKEHIASRKKMMNERMEKNNQLLENLKHIKVMSHDPPEGSKTSEDNEQTKNLPQRRVFTDSLRTSDIPRGLVHLETLINILHNHDIDPTEWTNDAIADKFKLRDSDVKDLLSNFSLIKPEDKFVKSRTEQTI
ncbi:unnamed protein product [Clavelina lepadiformis]|uniref:NADH dehydrogenase [ubiquinone] 1 alpha subcomplex assembly factor 4 n=1 Tax=Clavelina lepadiformis TaxID=159417 RepID=A0ABP0F0G9_CLALP